MQREGQRQPSRQKRKSKPPSRSVKILKKLLSPPYQKRRHLFHGSFCSRCGNRVPFESTFCNHCGTPIRSPSERETASKPDITRAPVLSSASQPVIPEAQVPAPPPESEPVNAESHVFVPLSEAKPVIPPVRVHPPDPPSSVTRVTVPPPAPQSLIPETPVPVPPPAVQPASTTGQALHSAGPAPDRQSLSDRPDNPYHRTSNRRLCAPHAAHCTACSKGHKPEKD